MVLMMSMKYAATSASFTCTFPRTLQNIDVVMLHPSSEQSTLGLVNRVRKQRLRYLAMRCNHVTQVHRASLEGMHFHSPVVLAPFL